MKSISLYDAFSFLRECRAIMIDGNCVEPYDVSYADDPDHEFLILQWEEEFEGDTFTVETSFKEGNNQMVEVDGNTMLLVNIDGETEEIVLLKEMRLENKQY